MTQLEPVRSFKLLFATGPGTSGHSINFNRNLNFSSEPVNCPRATRKTFVDDEPRRLLFRPYQVIHHDKNAGISGSLGPYFDFTIVRRTE